MFHDSPQLSLCGGRSSFHHASTFVWGCVLPALAHFSPILPNFGLTRWTNLQRYTSIHCVSILVPSQLNASLQV